MSPSSIASSANPLPPPDVARQRDSVRADVQAAASQSQGVAIGNINTATASGADAAKVQVNSAISNGQARVQKIQATPVAAAGDSAATANAASAAESVIRAATTFTTYNASAAAVSPTLGQPRGNAVDLLA